MKTSMNRKLNGIHQKEAKESRFYLVFYKHAENFLFAKVLHSLRSNLTRFTLIFQSLLQPSTAPLPEYKTAALKKSRFVLSHYGLFKSCWDWLILIATFYVAIVVPYNASFVNADKPSMVSDVVVEALFIVGELHFY